VFVWCGSWNCALNALAIAPQRCSLRAPSKKWLCLGALIPPQQQKAEHSTTSKFTQSGIHSAAPFAAWCQPCSVRA
jgi:hypothetical protein